MPSRAEHCNYDLYRMAMQGLPAELYGPGNEASQYNCGRVTFEQQLEVLRSSRAYFYTGTHPASYTLNFMEAWMTGTPVVAIGPYYGNAKFHKRPPYPNGPDDGCLYEVARLIEHGTTGFVSDNVTELRMYCKTLLRDPVLAKQISDEGRKMAIVHFGRPTIKERWKQFFETL